MADEPDNSAGPLSSETVPQNTAADETEIEDNYGDETNEAFAFKYSVSSYGADYPVDGLVKRMDAGDIYVPSFQRGYVWPLPQASRFIESLLLGLPVPGIFLSKEGDTNKLLVIDGQQRLRTMQYFYKGVIPKGTISQRMHPFALTGLKSDFDGTTYESLKEEDRRRLDDSIIHAVIVRQEQPSGDDSSIYHIFERLNTGSLQLVPQEIRACVYHGEFNELLRSLNNNPDWRATFGPTNKRMRDQELILRFFALYKGHHKYERPMKEFLNKYMASSRHVDSAQRRELTSIFEDTIRAIRDAIGDRAFRPVRALNAAVYDAVMVGVATRLDRGPVTNADRLREEYEALLEDAGFDVLTTARTTDEGTVKERVKRAIEAFKDIP